MKTAWHHRSTAILLFCSGVVFLTPKLRAQENSDFISNPVVEGYFADPSIVKSGGVYYIYATIDPWGGDELAVFTTRDFRHFDRRHLSWPTKKSCTSPTSSGSMVWAPSVVKAPNGRFYMYVSVGSEIWVGVSDDPLGPWKNAREDHTPLVGGRAIPGYHMIDAEAFIDEDGNAYLYWGSGLNWVNGHCFAVKLSSDMRTFDGSPKDITPPNYFEAPFMYKRNGVYFLMYSEGKAIDATYKVRYATGKTPFGPWKEGITSPILFTSADSSTVGPGHHAVFTEKGQAYILYHRIFPQKKDFVLRQLCIDSLNFDANGNVKKIAPKGVSPFCDESLAPTPPMGWNSRDRYGPAVSETEVRANAGCMAYHPRKYFTARIMFATEGITKAVVSTLLS